MTLVTCAPSLADCPSLAVLPCGFTTLNLAVYLFGCFVLLYRWAVVSDGVLNLGMQVAEGSSPRGFVFSLGIPSVDFALDRYPCLTLGFEHH